MRVLLFFPPQCRPLHPHLALPLIKAEMLRRKHQCRVVDLNLRFYEHALSADTLNRITCELEKRFFQLDEVRELRGQDAVQYARIGSALTHSRYIIDHVGEAASVFHTAEFYDYGRLLWAWKIIEEALDLYGAAFGHTRIGLSQLRMRYGTGSPAEIWAATSDPTENPFVGLLAAWADESIKEFNPDAIGITIPLDEQLIPAMTLARHLRETFDGLLVAGGSMITRLRENLGHTEQFSDVFDHYLPYESEASFGELVDRLDATRRTSTPFRKIDFTALCPDFDDLPLDRYFLPERMLPFQGTRGCSYGRCRYCVHYRTYERFRFGNPIAAAKQLQTLSARYSCRFFYFVDEALEPKFGSLLADQLESDGTDIRWMVFARLHRGWNDRIVKRISDTGCRRLIFGLDGATERVRALMDKRTDIFHAEQILARCAAEGIGVQVNCITGFPGEEEEEAREISRFIQRNLTSLSTLGSTVAIGSFVLVREAAWDQMAVRPIVDPERPLAIYYAYETESGLGMQEAPRLAAELQQEADQRLSASKRFPILREFALLYIDRFGVHGTPPKSKMVPMPEPDIVWFRHDLRRLCNELSRAEKQLPTVPQEYRSLWWRLATETELVSTSNGNLHGYQLTAHYGDNSFDLPLVEAFSLSAAD